MNEIFKSLDKQIHRNFVENYTGEKDILKVLDLSELKDDIDGLIEEMNKQPAVYAYWANLRRIAVEKFEKIEVAFEILKSRRNKTVIETLKSEGVKTPTGKAIEAKFHLMYKDSDWYKKYSASLKTWRKRKDQLAIIEKAISSREAGFKSLSYLLGNMMNHGLVVPKKVKRFNQ